jgi:hypothetical protein
MLLALKAFALQITRNHGLQKIALLRSRSLCALLPRCIGAMSLPALAACIVPVDFARSCSTDGVCGRLLSAALLMEPVW